MILPSGLVYVTRTPVPQPGIAPLFAAGLNVRQHATEHGPSRKELETELKMADAAIITPDDRIDAALLEHAHNLKVIATVGVQSGNVDLEAAGRRGVIVTDTAEVGVDAAADHAWALMLAAARGIVQGDRSVRCGEFGGHSLRAFPGAQLTGATLGILGLGRLGAAVARRAGGFNMKVLFTSRRSKPKQAQELAAEQVTVAEALQRSDFIVLTTRQTPETRHLLNADAFRLMRRSAVLVNVAGGALLDEVALVDALEKGRIAAAGLDVYENEPELSPGLAKMKNVVLTPHCGNRTADTLSAMMRLCCSRVIDVLCPRVPSGLRDSAPPSYGPAWS